MHALAAARHAQPDRPRRVRRGWLAFLVAATCVLSGCGKDPVPLWPGAGSAELEEASPARGMRLIATHGCTSCHVVPGVRGAGAGVGAALENMARRGYVAGVLPNTPANLVRWLRDPPSIAPRTAMPNVGLSHEEAADIAAYLLTLR